jgi:D-aminoacyl-tRNA deacylase
MKVVIQRVSEASVLINEKIHTQIGHGLLIFIGIEDNDDQSDVDYLAAKCSSLRIFNDSSGKMNLSIQEVHGEALVVSQFTLHAFTKKGNRPSYIKASRPEHAIPLYGCFVKELNLILENEVKTGVFGADMKVRLINDGPVTIIIDSKNKK